MTDDLQLLRDQIREAFPPSRFSGPVTTCSCEECSDIREALTNKSWSEIPKEFIDLTCSPTLLTPEAFQAFLPAYLLRALDDLVDDSIVLEFTVYCLCPSVAVDEEPNEKESHKKLDRLRDRARLMSPGQVTAIRAFLSFVAEHATRADWFRPFITASLETVWK